MQVDAHAASGNVALQRRAEIVDIELRGLLRIGRLQMHVLDGECHGRSPSSWCVAQAGRNPRLGQTQQERTDDRCPPTRPNF